MERALGDIEQQYDMDMAVAAALGWSDISHRAGWPPGENGPQQVPFYATSRRDALDALHSMDVSYSLEWTGSQFHFKIGIMPMVEAETMPLVICKGILQWRKRLSASEATNARP